MQQTNTQTWLRPPYLPQAPAGSVTPRAVWAVAARIAGLQAGAAGGAREREGDAGGGGRGYEGAWC